MWQVGIGNLMALVKTFSCSEISLTLSGTNINVKKKSPRFMFKGTSTSKIPTGQRTQQIRRGTESVRGKNVDRHYE